MGNSRITGVCHPVLEAFAAIWLVKILGHRRGLSAVCIGIAIRDGVYVAWPKRLGLVDRRFNAYSTLHWDGAYRFWSALNDRANGVRNDRQISDMVGIYLLSGWLFGRT